eukprot:1556820-Pyramimonas_sp.AAC.1
MLGTSKLHVQRGLAGGGQHVPFYVRLKYFRMISSRLIFAAILRHYHGCNHLALMSDVAMTDAP